MPRSKQPKQPKRRRLQRVSIRVEERREPDWDRFAWALLQYTKIVSAQADAKPKPGRPAP